MHSGEPRVRRFLTGPSHSHLAQCVAKNWIPSQFKVETAIIVSKKMATGLVDALMSRVNMMVSAVFCVVV